MQFADDHCLGAFHSSVASSFRRTLKSRRGLIEFEGEPKKLVPIIVGALCVLYIAMFSVWIMYGVAFLKRE